MTTATVLAGLVILTGLVGTVVPVLPGALLVWGAVLAWSIAAGVTGSAAIGWGVAVAASVVFALGWGTQYVLPGRRMKAAGVPNSTLIIALLAGVVGFFVVPVVGLPLFFAAAVYLVELARVGAAAAWPSTVAALKAAALSYGLEILTACLLAGVFTVGAVILHTR